MSLNIDEISNIILSLINDKSFYKLNKDTIKDVNKLVNYLQRNDVNTSQAELLLMHVEDDIKDDKNAIKINMDVKKKLNSF